MCEEILARDYPLSDLEDYGTKEELEMVRCLLESLGKE